MSQYRAGLPQLSGDLFLTDGGIETSLIFQRGLELPDFAAFHLLKDEEGCRALHDYYRPYAVIARQRGVGFVLESATWRASRDWGEKLGYTAESLADAVRRSIGLLGELRRELQTEKTPMVISGCVGPRGDGYRPGDVMDESLAQQYHSEQIKTLAATEADMVTAITMTYVEEAIGIARAASACAMPVAISFTVETDGRLPSGQALREAIEEVDQATVDGPAYYMINCAHPTHFEDVLESGAAWCDRIRGLRANASTLSHAELDEAQELDDGDPVALGRQYAELKRRLKNLNVLGGCCGTDERHVEEICKAFVTG